MARITEFEQQRLASSVVSDPSLDTSGARVDKAISQFGDTGMSVFGQQLVERQRAVDNVETAKHATAFEVNLEEQYKQHQLDNASDPTGKTDVFRKNAENMLNQTLSGIKSTSVRQRVAAEGARAIGQKLVQETDWSVKQQSANTLQSIATTSSLFEQQAYAQGKEGDIAGLDKTFSDGLEKLRASRAALTPESYDKMIKEFPKKWAKGAVNGLIEDRPDLALQVLDSGKFGEAISASERSKLKSQATARLKNIQEIRDFQYLLKTGSEVHPEVMQKYQEGTLTLNEIEALPDDHFSSTLKTVFLKANPLNAEEKADRAMALWQDYAALNVNKKTKNTKASLQAILDFQNKVLEEASNGSITTQRATSFIKDLSSSLGKRITETGNYGEHPVLRSMGLAGNLIATFGFKPDHVMTGYKSIVSFVDDNKNLYPDPNQVKLDMLGMFTKELGGKKDIPDDEIPGIIHKVKMQEARRLSPSLASVPDDQMPNAVHDAGVLALISSGKSVAKTSGAVKPNYVIQKRKKADGTWEYSRLYPNGKREIIK